MSRFPRRESAVQRHAGRRKSSRRGLLHQIAFESLEQRCVLAAPVAVDDAFSLNEDAVIGDDQLNAWTLRVEAAEPLHWWRFEEAGGRAIRDQGSAQYEGLVVGQLGFGVEGLVGRAIRLEGNGYVRFELPALRADWTMETIVGIDLKPSDVQGLLGTSSDGTQRGAASIRPEMLVNQEFWGITQFGRPEVDYSFGVVPSSSLTHVVMVGTSGGIDLYVDGTYASHVDHAIDLPRYAIGVGHADSLSHAAVELMWGLLDEMVIYDRALSAGEIAEHHRAVDDTVAAKAAVGDGVLQNDLDADGDRLTAQLARSTTHGQLNLLPDGQFTYIPAPDFHGTDSFAYIATDGSQQSAPATVTLTVRPLPDAPQAADDLDYLAVRDRPLTISAAAGVLANDRDADGDPLTVALVDSPLHGAVDLRPDGSFIYTPNAGAVGRDVFTYRVSDGGPQSALARVAVTVLRNAPGGAQDDAYAVAEDGVLSIEPRAWLSTLSIPLKVKHLAYDPVGDRIFAAVAPGNGPRAGTLTVIDPYTGALGPSIPLPGDLGPIVISEDGETLHVAVGGGRSVQIVDLVSMTLGPKFTFAGRIRVDEMLAVPGRPRAVVLSTWDPNVNQAAGIYIYDYGQRLPDYGLGHMLAIDEAGQHVYGYENWITSFNFWVHEVDHRGMHVVDTHPWGSMLSGFLSSMQYAQGHLFVSGDVGNVVDVALRESVATFAGGWTYRVVSQENTLYTFDEATQQLHAYDLTTFRERTTVALENLGAVHHELTRFGADGLALSNDSEVTLIRTDEIFGIEQYGVLRNDGQANAGARPVIVQDVSHGALDLHADGTFVYRPQANYVGLDQFRYQVTDSNGVVSTALVTINVTPRDDAPQAVEDVYLLLTKSPLSIVAAEGVLANDTDVDGDLLSASLVTPPQHGTVNLHADGSFLYTPDATYAVSDSFTYRAEDGSLTSTPQTVTIRLNVPTIEVGHVDLRPNQPNQRVDLYVTGGQLVSGLDLFAMIGDGGPELVQLGLPAGHAGPTITKVELKQNTIFASLPDVATNLQSLPQVANWSIAAIDGQVSVAADGLLATLIVDTTGFFEGEWELSLTGILPEHPLGPFSTQFSDSLAFVTNGSISVVPTQVLGRHIFYNHSRWDGRDAAATTADDNAVATDKRALLPGETATFANYTSYLQGINGVLLDLLGLPANVTLSTADFEFRMGRSLDPSTWPLAPLPTVQTRRAAGVNGSDRVTLIWPDGAIHDTWLQVTVKAGLRTLLAHDDVFYFGNAIGETGNDPGSTLVTSIDVIATRDHQRGPFDLASVDDVYDFNRDRIVSSIDVIVARDHQVGPLRALPLISPINAAPAATPVIVRLPGDANQDGVFDSRDLVQVFQSGEFEDLLAHNSTWSEGDWDGDGEFTTSDLVSAFQAGGYQSGSESSRRARPAASLAATESTRQSSHDRDRIQQAARDRLLEEDWWLEDWLDAWAV